MKKTISPVIGFACGVALLGALVGCASSDQPRSTNGRTPPPPAYVQNGVGVLQSDYVFYPAYQVYHSRSHNSFVYQEGGVWVSRSTPAGVSAEVLLASPSVRSGAGEAPTF